MLKAARLALMSGRIRKGGHVLLRNCGRAFNRIAVSDNPHFDEAGASYFRDRIASCANYLEYGSGGSTVAVARQRIPFTSVDSDRRFLAAVETKVLEATNFMGGNYINANIGMVTEWGYPLFKHLTPSRIARWVAYPLAPWPMQPLPDLVLIDGRFRVACALASIRHLYDKIDFEILFDDYQERPYYHAVEDFARLHGMHGRMAVLKEKAVSLSELDAAIEKFSTDFR